MKILHFFPGGNQSITRKWMEHQPSKKEHIVTLALGIISASVSYYYKSSYLITGATCFSLSYGLEKEQNNTPIDETPNPIRIMNFIVFSSLMGKLIRESWLNPPSIPNSNWKISLIKAPFQYISFTQSTQFLHDFLILSGKNISHINIDSNNLKKTIAITAILAISVLVSYIVPRSSLFFGSIALKTWYGIIREGWQQKSNIVEMLAFALFYFELSLLFSIGGTVGKNLRAIIGPKDYSLPYSLPATICLLSYYYTSNLYVFLSFAVPIFFHRKGKDFINKVEHAFPALDQNIFPVLNQNSDQNISEKIEEVLPEFKYLKTLPVSDSFQRIVDLIKKSKTDIKNISLYGLCVVICFSKKNQTVSQAVSQAVSQDFQLKVTEFYYKISGRHVPVYTPKDPNSLKNKEQELFDLSQRLDVVRSKIKGWKSLAWRKEQAAYVLLAPVDNRKNQRANYIRFCLLFHPDKNPGTKIPKEIMHSLIKSDNVLSK